MQDHDVLLVEYKTRVKASGEVVADTSAPDHHGHPAGPQLVILGQKMALSGVEAALREMKVGEERTLELQPEQAYGPRIPGLQKVMSLAKFRENQIEPSPGDILEIEGMRCRILSVSGGRVRVDFNHPLAGRDLVCTVKVAQQLTDPAEQLSHLVQHLGIPFKVEFKDGIGTLTGPEFPEQIQTAIRTDITKRLPNIQKIEFVAIKEEQKPEVPAEPKSS